METVPYSIKKPIWVNIVFFGVMALGGLIGGPLYVIRYGLSGAEIALFAFYVIATALGITVGYHRYFSHSTFRANKVVEFILLFFGSAAFEQTALTWSSQHRDHHRYVDTDNDPYSIKKGFWYAHIGWILFWEHRNNDENVKDLKANRLVMHQHNHYLLWAVGSGILTPMLIGALIGHMWGALIISVCFRVTFVTQCTFLINSVCHMFGKSTYDIYATAKDHWLVALLTFGEGYHNFHHRFPSDYRNGVRWYQWDPSKWLIAGLSKLGLTSHLCRVSDFSILSARLAGENRRVCDYLAASHSLPPHSKALETMKQQYEGIRKRLTQWEMAAREYKTLLADRVSHTSLEVRRTALKKLEDAQAQFNEAHKTWKKIIDRNPIYLPRMLLNLSV